MNETKTKKRSALLILWIVAAVLAVLACRLQKRRAFAALPLAMLLLLGVGLACGEFRIIIVAAVLLLPAAALLYKFTP